MNGRGDERVIVYGYGDLATSAVEYLLPCQEMPANVCAGLDPWLQQMVGLDPARIRDILLTRWGDIRDGQLVQLRQVALDHQPKSIVVFRGSGWLVLEKPFANGLPEGYPRNYAVGLMIVPPPVREEIINEGVARTRCWDSPSFREFVRCFGGCRDFMPDHSGHYHIPDKWETLFDFWGDPGPVDWYAEWRSALVVYYSGVGDFILLHPSGKVAWSLFAEGELCPLADTFQGFLQFLVNRQAVVDLDSYRGESL
jgi:hypothetical protein